MIDVTKKVYKFTDVSVYTYSVLFCSSDSIGIILQKS